MLVSHRKRFIFTKTLKTAGTSVESYFEPYCMPEGTWEQSHEREEHVSEAGVIGYRGSSAAQPQWYNHMPAVRIRELVGTEVWNDYYKFTTIRNPFDKMVSGFHMYERRASRASVGRKLSRWVGLTLRAGPPPRPDRPAPVRFRHWVRSGGALLDRDKYMIGGAECLDGYVRYEHLSEDLARVCEHLGLAFEPERLPSFKSGNRPSGLSVVEYYDEPSERAVRELYAWEIDRFGYALST